MAAEAGPLRTVIVDDEGPARDLLREYLSGEPGIEVVAECANGFEAVKRIGELSPELVFLDVQMPKLDGFEVLELIEPGPAVVFVTAYDEYALKAFEVHAVDYLLKPFSDERFQAALDRAVRAVRTRDAVELLAEMEALLGRTAGAGAAVVGSDRAPSRAALDRIVLKTGHRVRLLPVEQISWIEADGTYVRIHTRDNAAYQQRGPIGSMEELLDPRQFVRIHRSAIVNLDLVSELRQDAHGDYIAILRGGAEIRVGRRYRERLQARLGQAL